MLGFNEDMMSLCDSFLASLAHVGRATILETGILKSRMGSNIEIKWATPSRPSTDDSPIKGLHVSSAENLAFILFFLELK